MKLNELVTIAPRYTRSVNLERDIGDASAVTGYVLTPIGVDFLRRVQRVLTGAPGPRAWSITGPYGSGKSAFVLFLANLLSGTRALGAAESQKILKNAFPDLASELLDQRKSDAIPPAGFCPVLVSGSGSRIAPCLLESVIRDVTRFTKKAHRLSTLHMVQRLLKESRRGVAINPTVVVVALKELAVELRKAEKCKGIIIIADELGKFLEFAAHRPEENDIFVLQLLAEATVGNGKPDLLLVTVLHQAFDQYASGLRPILRNEWAKVQGRFEDVAFQDPPEETLRVLSSAIVQEPCTLTQNYRKEAAALASAIYDLGCAPPSVSKRQFCDLMAGCAPLHPVSALALARLCRKFGQNQRSLFSFLTSRNVNGFASFAERDVSVGNIQFFSLPQLYDYTADALGSGLNIGEAGTRWAEVTTALEAHRDLALEETQALKAIGLLSSIGPYGELKPSLKLLQIVLGHGVARKVCESLQKRSVLVYRKHSSSFALWLGSDIDFGERIEDAARRLSPNASLATRISSTYAARPLVAKRHSFATGTLRYFRIRFADVATFSRMLERDAEADGVVLYALPNTPAEQQELARLAMHSEARERTDVLVAIPKHVEPLAVAFRELELLKWVENNTPALQGDGVARKELRARLQASETVLEMELAQLFSPATSSSTAWYHRGIEQRIQSSRGLSHLLSDICNDVYCDTPKIKNELLNRRVLSSAAAKARRNLIQAMISAADKPSLGISGFPPELSMYRSLLEANGLHRSVDGSLFLAAPYADSSVHSAWSAIEKFFNESELQKRPISELFTTLQARPFGMKMGVIPVLFCAAAIVHDTEVAFYESGAFVPEVTIDVFERLLKSPATFELRSYRIEGVRKTVFSEYARLLGAAPVRSDNLVAIIKPLYRFFNRLQDYTKRTASLTPKVVAIREALLAARDPDQILFHDLPIACGFEPFEVSKAHSGSVRAFFHELQSGFAELQRCYDDLLYRLQQLLYQAFDIKGANARKIVQKRAATVVDYAVEPRMKAFIMHLCADDLEDVPWIEAIGALLAGKPPKSWNDADRARYEVSVSELSRNLRHIEALVFEITRPEVINDASAEVFRIGITDRHSKELEAVVSVSSNDTDILTSAIMELEGVLEKSGVAERPDLSLAALAAVSKGFLSRLGQVTVARKVGALNRHDS
ncbi:MAG: hypothetical protein WBQ43_06730 [Terriglobales bacterium]